MASYQRTMESRKHEMRNPEKKPLGRPSCFRFSGFRDSSGSLAMIHRWTFVVWILLSLHIPLQAGEKPLKIAPFEADITPPLGTPLCDGLVQPAKEIVDPLSARGIVLLGDSQPIVLCALDWVGVGNSGHTAFRAALARAAGTTVERVG